MGRLVLLTVLAAAIGGSVLTMSTRGTLLESSRRQAEGQEDVLAREIAEAGQSVALREMIRAGGFADPTSALGNVIEYDGGRFQIDYVEGATAQEATIRITGMYGGAIHTIESAYRLDPMDAPGPLWLDVPYATATVSAQADISGAVGNHPVHFDRRLHDELELEELVPLAALETSLGAKVTAAGSALAVPAAAAWEGGLLDDLNVNDAEGLYQVATGAMTATDVTITGDPVTGAYTEAGDVVWGAASDGTRITHVDGDLTITGTVRGHGALVVSGSLNVEDNGPGSGDDGRLFWNGIVIVRDTESLLPVRLDGRVDIRGMLVVAHQAFPPGGHLDVSVYRDQNGMSASAPQGNRSEQPAMWRYGNGTLRPDALFHQHTHAFDITPTATPRGDHVHYRSGGAAGVHEFETQFSQYLTRFGAEPVYLEFANADEHGYSRFHLEVGGGSGTSGLLTGTVQGGFGAVARADDPHRTKTFPANQFRTLDVDVASLRALHQAFDGTGACPAPLQWPTCIGGSWDRLGALAVRVRRASDDKRLYESTLYWHMRTDEQAAHEAEEAAWRAKIQAGEEFGTNLSVGDRVDLTFDIDEIGELTEKLGFEGDRVVLVSSTSAHRTPRETRSRAPEQEDGTPAPTVDEPDPDGDGLVPVCHKPGTPAEKTKYVDLLSFLSHLLHGDYLGPCVGGGSGGSGGSS